jgi:N-acetylglutamate synthase
MPLVLQADWMGRRVVVRLAVRDDRAVPGISAAGAVRRVYQDLLGDLVALDDDSLTIETRAGRVQAARSDVASARLVLPAARDVLALEATSSHGWRAREVETSADGWLLRADRGWTGRANSALALRTVRRALDDVLGDVTAWYADRGLPARIQVPLPAAFGPSADGPAADGPVATGPATALDHALARRGWTGADHTDVLVARLDLLAARTNGSDARGGPVDVRLDARPDDDWLAAYHYRGRAPLPAGAGALLSRHDHAVFARVELDGAIAAIGRGAVDDGWLGITALDVAASHRRLGLATAVVGALGRWAASAATTTDTDRAGAARAYVQTDQTNAAAHRLFHRLGFHQHHSYLYRSAPTINTTSTAHH